MTGRKPKPSRLKILGGETRPSRVNRNEAVANSGLADPPGWLSERAAEHFHRLSAILDGMQIASPDDVDNLAMLASRLDEIEICTAIIEDTGRTYQTTNATGDVMHRPRPEVGMRNEAMRHAQGLLSEFGLSPSARSKVSAGVKREENPFAALGKAG